MRSQTPSSSESSRSGSPDTRATTPSSTLEKSYLSKNFVYLASTALCLSTLQTLFARHASSGRMGLIVDHNPNATFPTQGDWVKQSLPSQPALEYSTSPAYPVLTSSVCQLGPIIFGSNLCYSFIRLIFPSLLTLFKHTSTIFSLSLASVQFFRLLWRSLALSMSSKGHLSSTRLFRTPPPAALLPLRGAHLATFLPSRNGKYCGHHGISSLFR